MLDFFGHHFCEHALKNTDWELVILDKLNYASGGFDRLRDIDVFDNNRVTVLTADISSELSVGIRKEIGQVDYIYHLAAESHVDNSIKNALPFIMSNVVGTYWMLEFARTQDKLDKFFYFSTDEVFGPAPEGYAFKEWDRYKSSNPYAGTKAGGEELCISCHNTHKVPVVITHTMNLIGERQHPEKFVCLIINSLLHGTVLTIHADPTLTKAGSRFYLHCRNAADALLFLTHEGEHVIGDKFNIVGEREVDNLELAQLIAGYIGKELRYKLVNFHGERPGHDLRYALSGEKMAKMGWRAPVPFEVSLNKTVDWLLHNPKWLDTDTYK